MNNKRIAQSDLSKWLKELFDYFKDYNIFKKFHFIYLQIKSFNLFLTNDLIQFYFYIQVLFLRKLFLLIIIKRIY